ncbi:hypothetical protein L3X38_042225 [Prunus dulcis]|uniref:Uncharacterized protein n=1 Tax=Prunus dulcis TaxID=3755 RepID=A0AAD4UW70_PRUDU|nr:hypothetical protein L3X38_042225 [Prunus dulcis]
MGSFGAALVNHEMNCGEDREEVLEWRNAFKKLLIPPGGIQRIIGMIQSLSQKLLMQCGIKYTSANDVRFVGIWGMGGMEMAWEIVRQEAFHKPGGRSLFWLHSDIIHVLTNNTGTEAIEGIVCLREFDMAHCGIPKHSLRCVNQSCSRLIN